MPDLPLPVDFRKDIIEPTLAILRSGESCALVGVGSSGKSNIARHLLLANVRLHYLQEHAAQAFILYLNCKPFAHRPPHDLYLHALDKLNEAAEELDGAFTPLRSDIAAMWQAAQVNPEPLAKRSLDRAIDRVVRAGAEHIIIILDDCDDLIAKAPPIFFSDLRELRDNHKRQVVYLTITRREPVYLRSDKDYEELFELLSATGHTIPITPYQPIDGLHMIRRLSARQDSARRLSDAEERKLFELSGGHAGLIRTIFFAAQRDVDLLASDSADRLIVNGDVEDECKKIWDSLEEEERAALRSIIRQETPPGDSPYRLQRRGLIHPTLTGLPGIFSPVFKKFIDQQFGLSPDAVTIEFADANRQVILNGEVIANLTWPEYAILHLLADRRPQPCPITPDLIEAMRLAERGRPHDRAQGNPVERLNRYVQQLKAKIGSAAQFIRQEGDSYQFLA